jgi:hypothetical protein
VATFGSGAPIWVPFVEDLRTSAARLSHPHCFADSHGIDALIAAVRRKDDSMRPHTDPTLGATRHKAGRARGDL